MYIAIKNRIWIANALGILMTSDLTSIKKDKCAEFKKKEVAGGWRG